MNEGTNTWIIQHCITPGCEVAIRVLVGNQSPNPICKWCATGMAYYAADRAERTP